MFCKQGTLLEVQERDSDTTESFLLTKCHHSTD